MIRAVPKEEEFDSEEDDESPIYGDLSASLESVENKPSFSSAIHLLHLLEAEVSSGLQTIGAIYVRMIL